jgi:hypothetical protein
MPAKEPAEAEARPTRRGGQVTAITLSGTQGLGRRGTFRVTDDMGAAIPRLRNPWLRTFLKTQGLAILISLAALIVSCVNSFWKPDNLVVYFRFNDPKEVGTNQLHVNYIFSNAGKTPAFIEGVSLTEIFYQRSDDDKAIPSLDVCKGAKIPTPDSLALISADVPPKIISYAKDLGYSRLYTPKTIYLGSVQSPFSSLNIDAGAPRAISAVYEMDAIDWNKFNVVLLCPVVTFFDASGHPSKAICEGFQSDQFTFGKDSPKGTRTTPAGLARLLPTSGSNCRVTPF